MELMDSCSSADYNSQVLAEWGISSPHQQSDGREQDNSRLEAKLHCNMHTLLVLINENA